MKRLFTLSAICVAALSLLGCGEDYTTKARKWICDHVDHYVCLDKERHALYYFGNHADLQKVDLNTMEEATITSVVDQENETFNFAADLNGYIIPSDKGYSNENSTFVIAIEDEDKYPAQAALIYDTFTGRGTKICQGKFVNIHNNIISCCQVNGSAITSVDVYDAAGNLLEPKKYTGTIARQSVMVELVEKDGALAGSYYYTKYGPGNRIYIYGYVDEDRDFEIEGFNNYGAVCEEWDGTFNNGTFNAEFTNTYNYRSYDFTLNEVK